MHHYIITGASRGLGEAVGKILLRKEHHVYSLSRSISDELSRSSRDNHLSLTSIPCDLSSTSAATQTLRELLRKIRKKNAQSITLINNAATIVPIRPIDLCSEEEIINTMSVNLIAPMVFTATFIKELKGSKIRRTVVNISSTGCRRTYDGLSCYITSKAGLSQFTAVVAEEQKRDDDGVNVILFEPGSMDTAMQEEIVSTPEEHCSIVQRFKKLKSDGMLTAPETIAQKITGLIAKATFLWQWIPSDTCAWY